MLRMRARVPYFCYVIGRSFITWYMPWARDCRDRKM